MSFDYLNDLFGRFRKKETKFTEVERRAVELLSGYVNGVIDKDSFGEQMEIIARDFHNLMKDESGNYVFTQDTPGWLNMFLGNKFGRWNHVRKIINVAKNKPEITSSPEWPQALVIMEQKNQEMMDAIKYCLKELK